MKEILPPNLALTNEEIIIIYMNRINENSAFHYYNDSELLKKQETEEQRKKAYEMATGHARKQHNTQRNRSIAESADTKLAQAVSYVAIEAEHAKNNRACNKDIKQRYIKDSRLWTIEQAAQQFFIHMTSSFIAAMAIVLYFFPFTITIALITVLMLMVMFFASEYYVLQCDFNIIRKEIKRDELEHFKNARRGKAFGMMKYSMCVDCAFAITFIAIVSFFIAKHLN